MSVTEELSVVLARVIRDMWWVDTYEDDVKVIEECSHEQFESVMVTVISLSPIKDMITYLGCNYTYSVRVARTILLSCKDTGFIDEFLSMNHHIGKEVYARMSERWNRLQDNV